MEDMRSAGDFEMDDWAILDSGLMTFKEWVSMMGWQFGAEGGN